MKESSVILLQLLPPGKVFYERLVGLVKQSLRKGMGRKILYWDKLMTLLIKVEAIISTHPLTYVYEEFKSGFVLTPAHF